MNIITRNGKLWIDFYHQSKRVRKSLGLDDNKANRKLAETKIVPELIYKLSHGAAFFENAEQKEKIKYPTVDEVAKISFEGHRGERKPCTTKRIMDIYRLHIKKEFGKKRLNEIKPSHLARWQTSLLVDKGLSTKRTKSIRTVFNTILEDAIHDEIIDKNPFAKVRNPKPKGVLGINPFKPEEVFQILEATPDHMRAFFAIGFFAGVRTGEIIALKWSDINLEEKIISIKRTRSEGVDSEPKTQNSIRDIEIIDVLEPYIREHKEKYKDGRSEYVFITYEGEPYGSSRRISSWYWKPLLKKLGLEDRRLYEMRHTFSTMMIQSGEDIPWVSYMLGHKDSSVTLQVYTKYTRQANKKRGTFLLDY